jgi:hypothetical protein
MFSVMRTMTTAIVLMLTSLEFRRWMALVALLCVWPSQSLGTEEMALSGSAGGDHWPPVEAGGGGDHWPEAAAGGGGDHWPPVEEGAEQGDWTLRAPDPTQAVELEGSNVCTKQET